MNLHKIKIVTDSSADTLELLDTPFSSVPLSINAGEKCFVDDENLDVENMAQFLLGYKGKSSSACPSIGDWLAAFEDAENVICITITSGLSGSFSSAMIAKAQFEEKYEGRRVFVLDSLSAGPELRLIIEKAQSLISEGWDFEKICIALEEYKNRTGLLFMLESMRNLANNGRVAPIVAKAAGLLGIRAVGKASDEGQLCMLTKSRGESKALSDIVDSLKKLGHSGGKVRIAHCANPGAAESLKNLILAKFEKAQVEIYRLRGLCSFYAEKGGLLVGFEK